jgi:hypothetical protein
VTDHLNSTDSEGLSYFCRHLVGLRITYQRADSDKCEFAIYSGMLIDVEGVVCFLTAGHVLSDLAKVRDSTSITITSAALADTFGKDAMSTVPIRLI